MNTREEYRLLDGRLLARTRHVVYVDDSTGHMTGMVAWGECTLDGEPIDMEAVRHLIVEDWTKRTLEAARLRDAAGERFDVC